MSKKKRMEIIDLEETSCGHRHIKLQRENVLSPYVYEQEFLYAWVLKKRFLKHQSHDGLENRERLMGYGKG